MVYYTQHTSMISLACLIRAIFQFNNIKYAFLNPLVIYILNNNSQILINHSTQNLVVNKVFMFIKYMIYKFKITAKFRFIVSGQFNF